MWNWLLEPFGMVVAGFLSTFIADLVLRYAVRIQARDKSFRERIGISENDNSITANKKINSFVVQWLGILVSAIAALGGLVIATESHLKRAGLWIMNTLGLRGTQLLVGMAVIVLGFGAFFFKLKYQKTYGIVEIVFGGVAAVVAARQLRPGGDWAGPIATLVGAVYIVSRGLNNVRDGFKARAQ